MSAIIEHLKTQFGYCVHCEEFGEFHYAWTFREALEWVACYPFATVTHRFHYVASRG